MRAARNTLIGLSLGLLLLVGALLMLDLGSFKPLYERIATHYLAREVQVAGAMSVRIGRTVMVSVEGLNIAGATPEAESFAAVGSAEVHLLLPSLLDGVIDLPLISIADAELNLEIDEPGQGNWPIIETTADAADDAASAPPALRVGTLNIDRAEVLSWNALNGRHNDLTIAQLSATTETTTLTVLSRGSINQRAFDTTLAIDGITSLLDINQWTVDWIGQVGKASFTTRGMVSSLTEWGDSALRATLHADSANEFLDTFSLPQVDEGPINVSAKIEQRDGVPHLDLDVQFAQFNLVGSAVSQDPATLQTAQIDLVGRGPNLAQLGALGGQDTWPTTPFEITFQATRDGTKITVETLRLDSEALQLELAGRIPDFRAPGSGRLKGTMHIPALSAWSDVLALPPRLGGPLTGSVALTGESEGADVLISTQSQLLALEIGGRIEPGESMLGSRLSLTGTIEQPQQVMELFMASAPIYPAISFSGEMAIENADIVSLKGFRAQIGEDQIFADGIVGWGEEQHATSVRVSVQAQDLRNTLAPWIAEQDMVPALPAGVAGVITYPAPLQLGVEDGALSMDTGTGQFSGIVVLEADNPTVSGTWQVTLPELQPLLPQMDLPPHFEKPLSFRGEASWQTGFIDIEGGELHFGATEVSGDLLVDINERKLSFDLSSATPDLGEYAPETDQVAPAFSAPVQLKARGDLTPDIWSVDEFELESTRTSIKGSGFLELDGDEFVDSHITGDINIANLEILNALVGFPLPSQDLQLKVDLDSRGGALVIEQFDLRTGDSDLSAAGRAIDPSDPEIVLDVESDRLDVGPWLTALNSASASETAQETPEDVTGAKRVRLIPDYAIGMELLERFRADVSIRVSDLSGLARPVLNVDTQFHIGPDGIRIDTARAENERGGISSLTGELVENANGIPAISVRVDGADLVLGIPKAPSEDITTLPSYTIKARLKGTGHTTRELAANLEGYVNVTMGEGKVLNAGLDRITNSFLQELSGALSPFQEAQESTNINCAAAFSAINKGQLAGKPAVVVDTPNVKIFADAAADFASEKIQVQFKTVPQKGLGLSMSSLINPYIEVTGTLAEPKLSLNPANTVVSGGLAVVTGGISIVIKSIFDRLESSGNVCATRLQKANEEMAAMDA